MIRGALMTFAAAVALLAWTSWRAIRVDAPTVATADSPAGGSPDTVQRRLFPVQRLIAAVDKDPFHPERRRPAQRFQLPSAAPPVPRVADANVRVVGTAVSPDGGFAMCSWAGGAPRIVRVGDRLGDWTLSKVMPGAAEFTGAAGSTIVVRIAKAGT